MGFGASATKNNYSEMGVSINLESLYSVVKISVATKINQLTTPVISIKKNKTAYTPETI